MHSGLLTLALCALQLWPAVLGGPQHQRFALGKGGPVRLSRVHNFAWTNCDNVCPGQMRSLTVMPDPICIPGDVTIGCAASTSVALEAPLKAVILLQKKLGNMWLKVPCMDQLGSCTYDDLCAELETMVPPGQPCPEPLHSYGIPCHCPFKAGTYRLPPTLFYIPNLDLPSLLTDGDYRIKAELSNGEQKLGCLKMSFSLHSQSQWLW